MSYLALFLVMARLIGDKLYLPPKDACIPSFRYWMQFNRYFFKGYISWEIVDILIVLFNTIFATTFTAQKLRFIHKQFN